MHTSKRLATGKITHPRSKEQKEKQKKKAKNDSSQRAIPKLMS